MKLKNIFLTVLFLFSAVQISKAQDENINDDFNTLFNNTNSKISGYGGPFLEYTKFIGQPALFIGGKGGVLFNRKFAVGLMIKGKTTRNNFKASNKGKQENMRISNGFGGVFIEYIWNIKKAIHLTTFANFMGGRNSIYLQSELDTFSKEKNKDVTKVKPIERILFFGIEPGLGIDINILQFIIANFNLSYRFVTSKSTFGFNNNDFSGLSVGIYTKFGIF